MNAVITVEQALRITGGRAPDPRHEWLVKYDAACKALAVCTDLIDAKKVADMADALAALAKIYSDGAGERHAKILKLKSYRTMGDLARQLRPKKPIRKAGKPAGFAPGSVGLLRESGLTLSQANAASHISKMPTHTFERLIDLPRPPSPCTVPDYDVRQGGVAMHAAIRTFAAVLRKKDPKLSALVAGASYDGLLSTVRFVLDWLEEFEQHLPKRGDAK